MLSSIPSTVPLCGAERCYKLAFSATRLSLLIVAAGLRLVEINVCLRSSSNPCLVQRHILLILNTRDLANMETDIANNRSRCR